MGLTWFQEAHPARIGLMTGLFSNASRVSALLAAPIIGVTASYFSTYRGSIFVAVTMVLIGSAILMYVLQRPGQNQISTEHEI
jgi:MFS transporter, SET family, sugar efflux transporter